MELYVPGDRRYVVYHDYKSNVWNIEDTISGKPAPTKYKNIIASLPTKEEAREIADRLEAKYVALRRSGLSLFDALTHEDG